MIGEKLFVTYRFPSLSNVRSLIKLGWPGLSAPRSTLNLRLPDVRSYPMISDNLYAVAGLVLTATPLSTLVTNNVLLFSSATIGILADEKSNTLFVTNVDNGVAVKTNPATAYKLSEIIGYDLTSGRRKFKVDLGALNPGHPNFINDLTLDNEGNLYVTNSFSPIIFKVDKDH